LVSSSRQVFLKQIHTGSGGRIGSGLPLANLDQQRAFKGRGDQALQRDLKLSFADAVAEACMVGSSSRGPVGYIYFDTSQTISVMSSVRLDCRIGTGEGQAIVGRRKIVALGYGFVLLRRMDRP